MKKVLVPQESFDSVSIENINCNRYLYVWGEYRLTWLGGADETNWAWTPLLRSMYFANGSFKTAKQAIEHVNDNNKIPIYQLNGTQDLIDYIESLETKR